MLSSGWLFWFLLVPLLLASLALWIDFPRALPVEPYVDGVTPVYIGRPYRNDAPSPALVGHQIVPVPRHLRFELELELERPARVLRLLSERNDNAAFESWERMDALHVNVSGRSCVLARAVAKDFTAGVHRLAPGGPVASAPLLVASQGEVRARTTASWNKLTPGSGPLDFVLRNKRKLAVLALTYAAWCALLLLLQRSSLG